MSDNFKSDKIRPSDIELVLKIQGRSKWLGMASPKDNVITLTKDQHPNITPYREGFSKMNRTAYRCVTKYGQTIAKEVHEIKRTTEFCILDYLL